MGNILATIFALFGFVCLLGAIACLFTPRAAFFLKNRTRVRGLLSWLGLCCLFLIGAGVVAPDELKQKGAEVRQEAAEKRIAKQQEKEAAKQAAIEKDNTSAAKAQSVDLLPYVQEQIDDTSTARRKRGRVKINLADPAQQFSPEQLAATCMAAAKFYAEEYGFQALSVFVSDIPGPQSWQGTRLAQCDYSPDKGGWSGDQGWLWQNVQAVPRPMTDQEREMKKLWGEMRGKYQKNGSTNEAALKNAIAKKMGIASEKIGLLYAFTEKVPADKFADIQAQGPSKPRLPELTEKMLRSQIKALLAELDSFRKSAIFKQCLYGCGEDNPGYVWNNKCKALREILTPQTPLPLTLKAAVGELYMLGKAYHESNAQDIKYFRQEIEKALK